MKPQSDKSSISRIKKLMKMQRKAALPHIRSFLDQSLNGNAFTEFLTGRKRNQIVDVKKLSDEEVMQLWRESHTYCHECGQDLPKVAI